MGVTMVGEEGAVESSFRTVPIGSESIEKRKSTNLLSASAYRILFCLLSIINFKLITSVWVRIFCGVLVSELV